MTTPHRGFGSSVVRVIFGFLVLFGLTVYAGPSPIKEQAFAALPVADVDLRTPDDSPRLVGPGLRALAAFSGRALPVPDSRALLDEYRRLGYRLADLNSDEIGVPRVFLTRLPRDLPDVEPVPVRKSLFIRSMLPLILRANEEIAADRKRIRTLRDRTHAGGSLSADETAWLRGLTDAYDLDQHDLGALLHRHDVVPVALALAQGIEESGWGTSRFALHGNAIFGQWTFTKGAGIVPHDREEGARHEVKAFDTLADSVRQYMFNLNSHRAYREFRKTRAALRTQNRSMDSQVLARTMTRYSQRGQDYVKSILGLIRTNELHRYDGARLQRPARGTFDS